MKKTNQHLVNLISEMKKVSNEQNVNIWRRVASDLEKATRRTRVVNLTRLEKYTTSDEVIVVPGKVLGTGELNHKLTVAAFSFSESAKVKIAGKGQVMSLSELLKKNPKGSKIKIIG